VLEEDLLQPRPLEDQVLEREAEQRLEGGNRRAAHEQRDARAVHLHVHHARKPQGLGIHRHEQDGLQPSQHPRAQGGYGFLDDEPPLARHGDALADALDLRQHVGTEEHRSTRPCFG